MGLFSTFVYSQGVWGDSATQAEYLSVDIHDSSFATVDYRPAGTGTGRLYLGYEPRHYFDDPTASEPVDLSTEADAFTAWALRTVGAALSVQQVMPLLADPDGGEPEDVFVEETVSRLLGLLALPLPRDLDIGA